MSSASRWWIKFISAGIVAFLLLNLFCLFYNNYPTRTYLDNGPTDYKWKSDGKYSQGTEGFAWGKFDSNGYNNLCDYNKSDGIDVLLVGSSHLQAVHVMQDKNVGSLLNEKFKESGQGYHVYNIGIGGQDFLHCASNFNSTMKEFPPRKYVVFEIDSVTYPMDELKKVSEGGVDRMKPAGEEDLAAMLSKLPYFQLVYRQWQYVGDTKEDGSSSPQEIDKREYAFYLGSILERLDEECRNIGCDMIIIFHPHLLLKYDGTVEPLTDELDVALFRELCRDRNITFIDMTKSYVIAYEEEHILPYGFCNSGVGQGHINEEGHRLMAEEIFSSIRDIERGK